jgi:hypothetical protein
MAKKKECIRCGCDRVITIVPKVTVADGPEMTYGLKRLCFICLVDVLGLWDDTKKKTINTKKAMECVSDL